MVYYEQLVLHPEANMRRILEFLQIEWNDAVLHHEQFIGEEVSVSKTEKSTDQIVKPVNLEALSSWVGHIPEDVISELDVIAPMLKKLGYDPTQNNSPNYGEPDSIIMENTLSVKKNSDYWKSLVLNSSIFET
jgi:protein-tyrosine sulfotransferase